MTRSIRLVVLGAGALAVLVLAGVASAAYTTPTLNVSQTGGSTTIAASVDVADDATARVAIYAPTGTTLTLGQAPGTKLGSVEAQASALDLGGALLPLAGDLVVAPPGAVADAVVAACTQGEAPSAIWLMTLQAAGQTLPVPVFVIPTVAPETALGPAKLAVCLGPPDVPSGTPGRATFGAKLTLARLTVSGVFSPLPTGAWIGMFTPFTPRAGTANAAGTAASPAAIAPGALTIGLAKSGSTATKVSGRLTQAGQGWAGAKVQIFAGPARNQLKPVGAATTKADGSYAFTYKKVATFFRTKAVVQSRSAPPLCAALSGLQVPCVNPTVNGFSSQTAIKRRPR
jgi:hypothetical protein